MFFAGVALPVAASCGESLSQKEISTAHAKSHGVAAFNKHEAVEGSQGHTTMVWELKSNLFTDRVWPIY